MSIIDTVILTVIVFLVSKWIVKQWDKAELRRKKGGRDGWTW